MTLKNITLNRRKQGTHRYDSIYMKFKNRQKLKYSERIWTVLIWDWLGRYIKDFSGAKKCSISCSGTWSYAHSHTYTKCRQAPLLRFVCFTINKHLPKLLLKFFYISYKSPLKNPPSLNIFTSGLQFNWVLHTFLGTVWISEDHEHVFRSVPTRRALSLSLHRRSAQPPSIFDS